MTICQFFEENVERFPNNIYLWEKRDGKYLGETYSKTRERVYQFAAGLIALGVKKGDRLALISEGRNDWVVSELGILYTGAVNVPLSVKLKEPSELQFRLLHSGTKMVIASNGQAKKIREIENQLPELEKIILLDQLEKQSEKEIYFKEIVDIGKDFLENNKNEFDKIWQSLVPDDYANICYTSGTTADPKGIILSHCNYIANVKQGYSLMDIPEHYKTLLILPWDHSFAHTAGIYCFMGKGASIASIEVGNTPMETLKNIPKNIKEIKPDFLYSVPSLAYNFRKNIEKGINEKGPFIKKLFNHALKIAYFYNGNGWNKGKGLKILLKPYLFLFKKLIFSKIKEGFGGKLKFFIGGGALLDIELQRFFYAINIPMYQGYGLTEAAPIISTNCEKKHKLGTSGVVVDKLELKICDDEGNELPIGERGEIVVKGENVMKGYWKNEEATKETLKNDWLHTGDLGYIDKDGFLYVLGRFKSLLIADDGEKYSPEGMEEAFINQSAYIDQCMLYNNQNPYTVALVYPNKNSIHLYLEKQGFKISDQKTIETICRLIEDDLKKYRSGGEHENMFPQRWLPASIAILNEGFTEENQLLNSTLKIVRGKIIDRYQDWIEFLYTPESKNINNNRNIESLRKLFSE
ncbi:MAG: AMP-binding protein [Bacteroidales bacterium]|nr:AMP-binding protein [Bacteroidales bacterium]